MNETGGYAVYKLQLRRAQFASAVYLATLAVIQVITNSLLLFAIYKDHYKNLRLPATIFIASLSCADLLTGLLGNSLISWYLFSALDGTKPSPSLVKVGDVLPGITVTVSNATILALSWVQLVSISYPYAYKRLITQKFVLCAAIFIWIYGAGFSLLQTTNIPHAKLQKADLYFNYTALLVAFVVTYILLYATFQRRVRRFRAHGVQGPSSLRFEHQFFIVNLILLSLHLGCTVPHSVDQYLTMFSTRESLADKYKFATAKLIIYDVLFLKFSVNVLVYGWRLPKYRKALNGALKNICGRQLQQQDEPQGTQETAASGLNHPRGRDTPVVLTSFTARYSVGSDNEDVLDGLPWPWCSRKEPRNDHTTETES